MMSFYRLSCVQELPHLVMNTPNTRGVPARPPAPSRVWGRSSPCCSQGCRELPAAPAPVTPSLIWLTRSQTGAAWGPSSIPLSLVGPGGLLYSRSPQSIISSHRNCLGSSRDCPGSSSGESALLACARPGPYPQLPCNCSWSGNSEDTAPTCCGESLVLEY